MRLTTPRWCGRVSRGKRTFARCDRGERYGVRNSRREGRGTLRHRTWDGYLGAPDTKNQALDRENLPSALIRAVSRGLALWFGPLLSSLPASKCDHSVGTSALDRRLQRRRQAAVSQQAAAGKLLVGGVDYEGG